MTLFLDPTLKPHFPEGLGVFEHMMSLQGEVFRHQQHLLGERPRVRP